MYPNPIIEEIHGYREQIISDSKRKGIDLLEYLRKETSPGFQYSDLKPTVTTLKKSNVASVIS